MRRIHSLRPKDRKKCKYKFLVRATSLSITTRWMISHLSFLVKDILSSLNKILRGLTWMPTRKLQISQKIITNMKIRLKNQIKWIGTINQLKCAVKIVWAREIGTIVLVINKVREFMIMSKAHSSFPEDRIALSTFLSLDRSRKN